MSRPESAGAAVVTHAIHRRVVDHGFRIHVMNLGPVHVHDRGVVKEISALPISALEARAPISESIVDTAVEADMFSPVPGIPKISSVAPSPIPGGPQKSRFRRKHPSGRYPVVVGVVVIPSPVTGRPKITLARTYGLRVNRKDRRGGSDRYADPLRERQRRRPASHTEQSENHERPNQQSCRADRSNF